MRSSSRCRRKRCVRSPRALAGARGDPRIACAKGIEHGTRKFMSEVIAECAPRTLPAILSGPSFAADVARGLPTAVTLAARDEKTASGLALALGSVTFRLYHRPTCAASRSAARPRTCSRSPPASCTAAGSARARRRRSPRAASPSCSVSARRSARARKRWSASGLGDLILTCSSPQSRNFSLGLALGAGRADEPAAQLAEGVSPLGAGDLAKPGRRHADRKRRIGRARRRRVDDAIELLLTRPSRQRDRWPTGC